MRALIRRLALAVGLLITANGTLVAGGLDYIETAHGQQAGSIRELVQWTHARLVFGKALERVAVGKESTLEVEILAGNEVLALAKNVGRTSLIVWYADGSSETFLFSVTEDLSVLRRALHDIHPALRVQTAPDRPALVLRGQVPSVKYRVAAEAVARNYLTAGKAIGGPAAGEIPLVQSGGGLNGLALTDANFHVSQPDIAASRGGAAIINLIQVETLPQSTTEKIRKAITSLGGEDVRVRRIVRGAIEDDRYDTLILEGRVRDQVTLTRILHVASRLFVGTNAAFDPDNIAAVADESGALLAGRNAVGSNNSAAFGGVGSNLDNEIRANIARSRLLSVSGGRILSMIEVQDVPLVRVAVQMHEINRNRMKNWRPDLSLISNGYNSSDGRFGLEGLSSRAPGSSAIENALQIIGGTLTNNLQVGNSAMAFDLLFSLLEDEGISRTLSRPTLTTLAGEPAVFLVGGQVPVPTAFAPTGLATGDQVGSNTPGVFSGTEFKSFGVQLRVRAMVDEHDRITLDLNPTISSPDALLTQQIAGSTGSGLNSTAFSVRSLDTSTRLRDGQPLVLGGLVSRNLSDQNSYTPGLHNVPLLGWFSESISKMDVDRELVIVVTPTLVREPVHDADLWRFPSNLTLLDWGVGLPGDGIPHELEEIR